MLACAAHADGPQTVTPSGCRTLAALHRVGRASTRCRAVTTIKTANPTQSRSPRLPAGVAPAPAALPPAARRRSHVARFQPLSDARLTKRESELAIRKMYLTNFWYAVGFTNKIGVNDVYTTKLLDTEVVLWRDRASKEIRCVTDRCPSSGAKLSAGLTAEQLASGTVRCADAGAAYDVTTGQRVPHGGEAVLPGDTLEIWDCVERGGFVWLFFGNPATSSKARPAIPWVPELNKPGWREVHGEVMIKNNHWTVIENVIDMAHVPYVHKGTVGDHAAFVDIVIDTTPTTLNFAFPIENHHAAGTEAAFKVDTRATACLPSTSFIRFTFPWDLRLVTINSVVPIDEQTTCIRFCQMRNFLRTPLIDPLIHQGMKNILGEDKVILEMLSPHEVTTEVSLKADAPQLALRKMRERYINAGSAVRPGARALNVIPPLDDALAKCLNEGTVET